MGDKYTKIFNAVFQSANQTRDIISAGCYGLGVTRIVQAIAEIYGDEHGLRFPPCIAPFHVLVLPSVKSVANAKQKQDKNKEKEEKEEKKLSFREKEKKAIANCEQYAASLDHTKLEVLVDDRIGVSFMDRVREGRQIGVSFIVVCGPHNINETRDVLFEFIDRQTGTIEHLTAQEISQKINRNNI